MTPTTLKTSLKTSQAKSQFVLEYLPLYVKSELKIIQTSSDKDFGFGFPPMQPSLFLKLPSWAVLENRILPSLYRSRKHSDKDVSSVVIHCRKFFSHFPHIGFGRITHNASLPDRWLQQVIFTFDQAAQPESSAVLSCYG